jgi:hypothetical protein
MTQTLLKTLTTRAALVVAAVAMAGCSANYSTGNTSTVLLIIAAVNGGAPLKSDVLTSGAVVNDPAELAIAVRFKNPNIATIPQIPSAVIIERYEVSYRRSDGRGVEGQDVPYRISGNVTAGFDVKSSGTDPLSIDVVRAQAKLESPLRNLRGVSTNTLGGAFVLTLFADITIHGRTISGQPVTATGSLQIDFADYGD